MPYFATQTRSRLYNAVFCNTNKVYYAVFCNTNKVYNAVFCNTIKVLIMTYFAILTILGKLQ